MKIDVENVYNYVKVNFSPLLIFWSSWIKIIRFDSCLKGDKMYVNKIKAAFWLLYILICLNLLVQIILETLIAETIIYVFVTFF